MAFGGGDGSVWVWDFRTLRRLGKPGPAGKFNTVRFIHFTDENRLLSLAEDGKLLEWKADAVNAPPTVMHDFMIVSAVFRAELSPDGRWLAAAAKGTLIKLRNPADDDARIDIHLKEGEAAHSLAFDPKRDRLAVGIAVIRSRRASPSTPTTGSFSTISTRTSLSPSTARTTPIEPTA